MLSEDKFFKDLTPEQVWQRYCGFLKLSVDEFMQIQRELLMDEIERVADSVLGKKIMNGRKPESVEEFRQMVPLTTYEDYRPYLSEKRDDALAEKPYQWIRSSGRSGYVKWAPLSFQLMPIVLRNFVAGFILASAKREGDIHIGPGCRILGVLPPPPYGSGTAFRYMQQNFTFKPIPPLTTVEQVDFQERMVKGLLMALRDGVDCAVSLSSIMAKIGQGFTEQTGKMKFSPYMLHPLVIFRMLRAKLRSRKERRTILPKDLWPVKGIVTGGVDNAIYKEEISRYWGVEPWDFYVSNETSMAAMQAWNKKGMTFLPDVVFLEFIPADKPSKAQNDKFNQPRTVLLSEVEKGKLYEVVITHFYGMPLLRYRMHDIFKVVALGDDEAGINLPQLVFQRRSGDTIDLAGLAALDEKTIWRAITNTGIKCNEWTTCKEYDNNQSFIRIYLELREDKQVAGIERMLDEQLRIIDEDYRDIDYYLQAKPVRVTLLKPGTFQLYAEEKRKGGADMAFLKPVHINPPDADIQLLIKLSKVAGM